jgi:4-hydroxybenzoate polyprenyltransferase
MNIIKRLYIFQKERFPLRILIFTTLSSVLASAAIVDNEINVLQIIIAFFVVMLLLFHIRAIDESRDFKLDSNLHPTRPVQRGIVSVKQILTISITGICISLFLAYISNLPSFIITVGFVLFTFFAWKDFFVPVVFQNKPVLYHIINSPQMLLIQWLIYTVLSGSFRLNLPKVLFMLLVYNNIFLLEITRKVKVPDLDTKDTYSAHLGLLKTCIMQFILVLAGFVIFGFILQEMDINNILFYCLGGFVSIITLFTFWKFKNKPKVKIQKASELFAVLFYILINILIYTAK